MSKQLTEEESRLCHDVMTSFGEADDAVSLETLLTMMRALGSNPVIREVKDALMAEGKEVWDTLTFADAERFIQDHLPEVTAASLDIADTISKLDTTGSGTITDTHLRAVVTATGSEPLTPAEADSLEEMLCEDGILHLGEVSVSGLIAKLQDLDQ